MELDDIVKLADPEPATPEAKPAAMPSGEPQAAAPQSPPAEPAAPAEPQAPASTPDYISRGEFNNLLGLMTQMAAAQRGQQAAAQQPQPQRWTPAVPRDPDALLTDGNSLVEHVNGQIQALRDYQDQHTGQALGYVETLIQRLSQQVDALTSGAGNSARDRAKAEIEKMGFEDFDELSLEAERMLAGNPQAVANPQAWKEAYLLARARANKPFRLEAKATPPPSLGAKPPARTAGAAPDFRGIRDEIEVVRKEFGLDGPFEIDAEHLQKLRQIGAVN